MKILRRAVDPLHRGPGGCPGPESRPGEFWAATACGAPVCGANACDLIDDLFGFNRLEFDITGVELDACEAILLESQMLAANDCPPDVP